MKKAFQILQIAFLLSAVSAHADILFIDFNNNDGEIAAARRAAEARHEKLIVITNDRSQTEKAPSPVLYMGPMHLAGVGSQAPGNFERKVSAGLVGKKRIEEKLTELEAHGTPISSVIISGHDGNGHFMGEPGGDITSKQLSDLMDRHSKIKETVRSFYLWGCYTSTPGSIEGDWKKIFPHVEMIAGFNGSGPRGNSPPNPKYLESLLKTERDLVATSDEKRLLEKFQSVDSVRAMNTSALVCDHYLTAHSVQPIEKALGDCVWPAEADRLLEQYTCYQDAQDPKCSDVPANTQTSILRDLYNLIQSKAQCRSGQTADTRFFSLPNGDQLIRLIHFKNVLSNFIAYQGKYLKDLDQALLSLGAKKEETLGDLQGLSRGEVVQRIRAIDRFLVMKTAENNKNKPKDKNEESDTDGLPVAQNGDMQARTLFAAYLAADSVAQSLNSVDGYCVPFQWVDANAKQNSPCGSNLSTLRFKTNPNFAKAEASAFSVAQEKNRSLQAKTEQLSKQIQDFSYHRGVDAVSGKQLGEISRQLLKIDQEMRQQAKRDRIDGLKAYGQSAQEKDPNWKNSQEAQDLKDYLDLLATSTGAFSGYGIPVSGP